MGEKAVRPLVEYLSVEEAAARLGCEAAAAGVTEFACVRNLDYVFCPFDLYALAPHSPLPLERAVAFAVDMDGTSTTTEPLALHALEYMVRRFTGRMDRADWPGLDEQRDYPYVIGNSNFRHTEFLVERYGHWLDQAALRQAFFEALTWTLANLDDPQRRHEVALNARNCGVGELLEDAEFKRLVAGGPIPADELPRRVAPVLQRFGGGFRCRHQSEVVAAALDVYYLRYHEILRRLELGEGEALSRELLGESGRRLVEPMPGYAMFVALIKGWLGAEAAELFEPLRAALPEGARQELGAELAEQGPRRLARLGEWFERTPARLALVTASIAHEAHAVMKEVVRQMAGEASCWPVSRVRREQLAERLSDYQAVFDAFVNASDAHEARLKPHRDLYSIALFRMSIPKSEYACCVGIEDTEPGIVALRAAGVGCAVALPNRDTSRQNYSAASRVVTGGLPALILVHNLMLREERP